MSTVLTKAAQAGYADATGVQPHKSGTRRADAWLIGQWMNTTHRTTPRDVDHRDGRRYEINDMLVAIAGAGPDAAITRVG